MKWKSPEYPVVMRHPQDWAGAMRCRKAGRGGCFADTFEGTGVGMRDINLWKEGIRRLAEPLAWSRRQATSVEAVPLSSGADRGFRDF